MVGSWYNGLLLLVPVTLSLCSKPLVPVHHMAAHALTPRLFSSVPFPYLILLVSGGHCLLLVAEGAGSFQRLGYSLDRSPGKLVVLCYHGDYTSQYCWCR